MKNPEIRIYESDNSIKHGQWELIKEIIIEITQNQWLIYQLFKRNFVTTYRQSLMGISWAFVMPLLSVLVFVMLNRSGVLMIGTMKVPYLIYAISGIAVWQLFSVGVVLSANSIVKAGSMVVKIQFSKISLVIADYAQAFIPFIIQIMITFVLMIVYGIPITIYTLFFPITIIPLIMFSFGIGLLFSLFNAVLRDIGNLISTFTMFLLLITPILYASPQTGVLAFLNRVNILYYLISFPRDVLLFGTSDLGFGYLVAAFLSGIFYVCSLVIFHLTEVRIAERI